MVAESSLVTVKPISSHFETLNARRSCPPSIQVLKHVRRLQWQKWVLFSSSIVLLSLGAPW